MNETASLREFSRSGAAAPHGVARAQLAAAFRWAARLNLHEGVANHFSYALGGGQFLINPNQRHFSRIRASDLLTLDAEDAGALERAGAPDPTAWGLHASVHRRCPHARCVMHAHPPHATVLASLADSVMRPIDQNTAMFYGRHAVDEHYGGLAFEEEGERCAALLADPKVKALVMGNHGVLILGGSIGEAFDRLYYFERAAQTYVSALATGAPLRMLGHEVAEKTAAQLDAYPGDVDKHLAELMAILDEEGSNYRD